MEWYLVAILVIVGVIAVVALVQVIRYEKELRHMARFLDEHQDIGSARLTVNMRTQGVLRLGSAINTQFDLRHRDASIMRKQSRELRDGLAYLSHDIRTPLMGAKGYLQLQQTEADAQEKQRYLGAVDERLGALQSILDQLFLFTQVSNADHEVQTKEVVLSRIVSEVLVSFYPQFEERGWGPHIELDESTDSTIYADPDAVKRILENLTNNTLKHGSGAPTIRQAAGCITFVNPVSDPQALDIDSLFDRFYMADQASRGQGSGLGLAIVKQLAQSMNAQVEAHLEEDLLHISIVFLSA